MKKVFIIHGFEGSPNGGWRPWLMSELEKQDIYACALSMPSPEKPDCHEWVGEISRHVDKRDEVYLVGHSLGVPAILHFLESIKFSIAGAVLVSGPSEKNENKKLDSFLKNGFDYKTIKLRSKNFVIIHGDNDPLVPLSSARIFAKQLNGKLIVIKNGGHLNGRSGWCSLPQCLEALLEMMKTNL